MDCVHERMIHMPYISTAAVLEMERQRTGNYGDDVKQDKQCEECGTADQLYEVAGMVYCKECLIRELKSTMKKASKLYAKEYPCSFNRFAMDKLCDMICDDDMEWLSDTSGVSKIS